MKTIDVTRMVLGFVIGRCGIGNTASSLWPCQTHSRGIYTTAVIVILNLFFFLQVGQVMGKETAAPSGLPSESESAAPNAPAPMTDIHDIQPPVSLGMGVTWLALVLLALTAAAILVLGWWLWKKRKKARIIETIVPELPPEMTAMRALDQISDVRRMDGKVFYFRLSAILRQYVFDRFAVGALEMTTEEFVPCIDRMNLDHPLARGLRGLCRAMDPVKFGSATPVEKQMETDLLFAREFVRKTTHQNNMEDGKDHGEPSTMIPMIEKNSKEQIPNLK